MVPPGLRHKTEEFEAHFAVAKGAPIIICGPSGVGKSLFLHLFKKLYRETYKGLQLFCFLFLLMSVDLETF